MVSLRSVIPVIAAIAFLLGCNSQTDRYTITGELMVDKPISNLLYSHFIELGYGLQVEPMWGEMLFNRSFEPFPPYRDISKVWFDLFEDKKRTSFKHDWTQESWYHSGYEHNPWFAAPGAGGIMPINDSSTFLIPSHPGSPVSFTTEEGGIHGEQYLNLINHGKDWGGVAQEGIFLNRESGYQISAYLDSDGTGIVAQIRVYPQGTWDSVLAIIPLTLDSEEGFERFEEKITLADFEGWATLALWIPPGSVVQADAFSLTPSNTIDGWRLDAIHSARRINPGVLRIPGGCFASFYNWRDGLGPKDQRSPQPSYFWGGFNYNDVGVAELAGFAGACGAEMMYCVNLYHPNKEKWSSRGSKGSGSKTGYHFPEFTDPLKGASEAAALVAYCNLPGGTHPMADLRVKHGFVEPFGIKYWEMDNEPGRWFSAEEYARTVSLYARAMKEVDPGIEIGMVSYGGRGGEPPYIEQLEAMLHICGPDIDFLADRRGSGPDLDEILGIIKYWEDKTGQNIYYCNTEKLFYEGDSEKFFPSSDSTSWINRSSMFGTWHYAMNVLRNYMAFQRKGGDIKFVNFNNLANTHNQCVINTPKEGTFLSASGVAMELLSRTPAAWPLRIDNYAAKTEDEFQVQAAYSGNREALVVYVFNRTNERRVVKFDLSGLDRSFKKVASSMLRADGPLITNSQEHPQSISRINKSKTYLREKDELGISSAPYSFTEVVMR